MMLRKLWQNDPLPLSREIFFTIKITVLSIYNRLLPRLSANTLHLHYGVLSSTPVSTYLIFQLWCVSSGNFSIPPINFQIILPSTIFHSDPSIINKHTPPLFLRLGLVSTNLISRLWCVSYGNFFAPLSIAN